MGILDGLMALAKDTPAGFVTSTVAQVLDHVLPEDPAAKEAAALKIMEMQAAGSFEQRAELQTMSAQIDVDKAEAQASGFFKGGWRPATGWMCVIGIGAQVTVFPLASWAWEASTGHKLPPLPPMDTSTLLGLLVPLLGLGAYRTAEKIKGAN